MGEIELIPSCSIKIAATRRVATAIVKRTKTSFLCVTASLRVFSMLNPTSNQLVEGQYKSCAILKPIAWNVVSIAFKLTGSKS